MRALVVGAGGLLGGAVVRDLRRRGVPRATVRVPWGDHAGAVAAPKGDEATRIRRTMTMTIALRNRSP